MLTLLFIAGIIAGIVYHYRKGHSLMNIAALLASLLSPITPTLADLPPTATRPAHVVTVPAGDSVNISRYCRSSSVSDFHAEAGEGTRLGERSSRSSWRAVDASGRTVVAYVRVNRDLVNVSQGTVNVGVWCG